MEPDIPATVSRDTMLLPDFQKISLALIFVLLTFGGWNEVAYVSSELKTGSRKIRFVLVASKDA